LEIGDTAGEKPALRRSFIDLREDFDSTFRRMNLDPANTNALPSKRPHVVRRLYDWTLSWADRPGGVWALFLIAVIESSVFPVPPDVLLLALCVGAVKKSFWFAAVCAAGSVLGGVIGYGIGSWAYDLIGDPIVRAYQGEAVMARIKDWYDTYGFWGTLIAAVTPIPYKVFTIASGMFSFPFGEFLLASVIGRSLRFFLVAGFIYYFGAWVKALIEKYFDWFALAFVVLLVGGFVLIKFLR
jgi:membrane protein YqaA with SNARE-associated domain